MACMLQAQQQEQQQQQPEDGSCSAEPELQAEDEVGSECPMEPDTCEGSPAAYTLELRLVWPHVQPSAQDDQSVACCSCYSFFSIVYRLLAASWQV